MTTIEVWSDVVCPWCWIGEARLRRAIDDLGAADSIDVRIRSFQLDPDARRGPALEVLGEKFGTGSDEELLERIAPVVEMGRELGLPMDYERAVSGPTGDAHRLIQLAAASGGRDAALMDRLHRAHFEEGLDVADHATLSRLAVEAGLDAADVERVLASDELADVVTADQEQALSYGITGVPFFVLDSRYAIGGAQPLEVFQEAVRRTLAEHTTDDEEGEAA